MKPLVLPLDHPHLNFLQNSSFFFFLYLLLLSPFSSPFSSISQENSLNISPESHNVKTLGSAQFHFLFIKGNSLSLLSSNVTHSFCRISLWKNYPDSSFWRKLIMFLHGRTPRNGPLETKKFEEDMSYFPWLNPAKYLSYLHILWQ